MRLSFGHRPALLGTDLLSCLVSFEVLLDREDLAMAPRTDGPQAPLLGPDAGPWFIRVLLRTPFYVGRRAASGHRPCFFSPSLWTREIPAPCLRPACVTRVLLACRARGARPACVTRVLLACRARGARRLVTDTHADTPTAIRCARAQTHTHTVLCQSTAVACSELFIDCLCRVHSRVVNVCCI